MNFFTIALGLFGAIANIKSIAGYLEEFARGVTAWYVGRAQTSTLAAIADAAAFAARATNSEERFQAAERWQRALSKPRVSP